MNAILIGIGLDGADSVLLPLYNLELLLKIYASGPYDFFRMSWNRFDFLVITLGTILAISRALGGDDLNVLDLVLVLRVLRLVRILARFQRSFLV